MSFLKSVYECWKIFEVFVVIGSMLRIGFLLTDEFISLLSWLLSQFKCRPKS